MLLNGTPHGKKIRRGQEIIIPYPIRNYIALTFTSSKYGIVITIYKSVLFDYP